MIVLWVPTHTNRCLSSELKDSQGGQSATGKKKKKKKGKNSANASVNGPPSINRGGNDSGKENGDEQARIVHNPGSNMVTIRNPAFGPPPKMMDTTQQAAIIKVAENGMVTIRSPALQQAINAGMTPPQKPDFIVKGEPASLNKINVNANTVRMTLSSSNTTNHKNTNGIIPTTLAEFRSRLTPDYSSLPGLANIQISNVTNGQPIPEGGINIKGTSVTLTKVRTPEIPVAVAAASSTNNDDVQQAKSAVRDAITVTMNPPGSGKSKKKKKRGNGSRPCGDDWNLVGEKQ